MSSSRKFALILAAAVLGFIALSSHASAGTFGAEITYGQIVSGNLTAWDGYDTGRQRYVADMLVHGSWHGFVFEVQPYLHGASNLGHCCPTVGGLFMGAGYDFGRVIVFVSHQTEHNLDWFSSKGNARPSLYANIIGATLRLGDRRTFSLGERH